jgi:hypothetical protein
MAPAEREFVAVAVHVLLAEVVKRAVMAAFQQGEERFGRIVVGQQVIRDATNILAASMIDGMVRRELAAVGQILLAAVGH